MNTITKLICPECRHENEAERVYCHDCGARLNKPAAAAARKTKKRKQSKRANACAG